MSLNLLIFCATFLISMALPASGHSALSANMPDALPVTAWGAAALILLGACLVAISTFRRKQN